MSPPPPGKPLAFAVIGLAVADSSMVGTVNTGETHPVAKAWEAPIGSDIHLSEPVQAIVAKAVAAIESKSAPTPTDPWDHWCEDGAEDDWITLELAA